VRRRERTAVVLPEEQPERLVERAPRERVVLVFIEDRIATGADLGRVGPFGHDLDPGSVEARPPVRLLLTRTELVAEADLP
jgi:hypothetical protein